MGSLNDSNKTSDSDRSEVVLTDETSGIQAEVKTFAGEDRLLVADQNAGNVGELFIENAELSSSPDLRVDGTTPKSFKINADATDTIKINELRFYAGGTGIKFDQFLTDNGGALSTGIKITIVSDGNTKILPLIFKTEDFNNKFAFGVGNNFTLQKQTGADQMLAKFIQAIVLVGGSSDYVEVLIQDDLTAIGLDEFEFLGIGYIG
jgi:hypothetical protein